MGTFFKIIFIPKHVDSCNPHPMNTIGDTKVEIDDVAQRKFLAVRVNQILTSPPSKRESSTFNQSAKQELVTALCVHIHTHTPALECSDINYEH